MTRLQAGQQVEFPASGGMGFFSLYCYIQTGLGAHPAS